MVGDFISKRYPVPIAGARSRSGLAKELAQPMLNSVDKDDRDAAVVAVGRIEKLGWAMTRTHSPSRMKLSISFFRCL